MQDCRINRIAKRRGQQRFGYVHKLCTSEGRRWKKGGRRVKLWPEARPPFWPLILKLPARPNPPSRETQRSQATCIKIRQKAKRNFATRLTDPTQSLPPPVPASPQQTAPHTSTPVARQWSNLLYVCFGKLSKRSERERERRRTMAGIDFGAGQQAVLPVAVPVAVPVCVGSASLEDALAERAIKFKTS